MAKVKLKKSNKYISMKIDQPENELLGRTTKLDATSSLGENIIIKETNSITNSEFM